MSEIKANDTKIETKQKTAKNDENCEERNSVANAKNIKDNDVKNDENLSNVQTTNPPFIPIPPPGLVPLTNIANSANPNIANVPNQTGNQYAQAPLSSFQFTNVNGMPANLPGGYNFPTGMNIPFIPINPPEIDPPEKYEQFVPVDSDTRPTYVVDEMNSGPKDHAGQHMFKFFDMYGYQKTREWEDLKKQKQKPQKVTKKQIQIFKKKKKQRQLRSLIERLNK
ncbi:hypothetical protein MHBO_002248 [Bonamia ostreae]|uniref:Uncharacterized protein n=1 Tax=Bonamia ostreae TaxID=126728 RepID=A0ABV2AMC3_9EUKA